MTQRRLAGTFIGLAMLTALPSLAWAEGVCANKPSKLAGAAVDRAGDVARTGARVAGNYMLMHPGQSVKLVTGAAGTVSSATTAAGGVGGLAASVTAVVTAPVTLVVGAVAFAAVGSYEGLCYFQVERLTDPDEVRAIVDSITETDPLVWTRNTNKGPVMVVAGPEGEQVYPIRKLYIADGLLKVRDWGLNSTLGPVAYVQPEEEE